MPLATLRELAGDQVGLGSLVVLVATVAAASAGKLGAAGGAAGGDGGRGRDVFVRPKHTCFNYGKY